MNPPYRGSCLCETIRFEVDAFLPQAAHCHYSMCRKFHGAALATFGSLAREHFRWLHGQSALQHYTASNGSVRAFCQHCGSSVSFFSPLAHQQVIEIALGLFDDAIPVTPDAHIYVGSGANWIQTPDGLTHYQEGRESQQMLK